MMIAVIPAYNESRYLKEVILKTKKFVSRVIVVDDGSKDKTYDIAKRYADVVLRNIINMGKGFALKTGFEEAIKEGANAIVTIDADGQHDPSEIPKLVKALSKADFIIGSRNFEKMPFRARFANSLLSSLFRFLFGTNIKDTQSGFRAMKSRVYNKIKWKSSRYGVETEMLANAVRHRVRIAEVPIRTIYHEIYKGTSFIDGMKILCSMIRWRLLQW